MVVRVVFYRVAIVRYDMLGCDWQQSLCGHFYGIFLCFMRCQVDLPSAFMASYNPAEPALKELLMYVVDEGTPFARGCVIVTV